MVVIQDITARKNAEAALWESEMLLRVAFTQAAVGIAVLDHNLNPLRVNEKFCEISGQTRDSLLKMRVGDLTHADDREMERGLFDALTAQKITHCAYEKRYVLPDESVTHAAIEISASLGPDGKAERFIAIVQDITESKQIQTALR